MKANRQVVNRLREKLAEARENAATNGRSAVYWMRYARRELRSGDNAGAFASVLTALTDRGVARGWREETRRLEQVLRGVTS